MIPFVSRRSPVYTGTGAIATYAFAFKVFDRADIAVQVVDGNGATSTKALDTDYTVSLNADQDTFPGGSITLTAGNLATGFLLTVTGNQAYSQTTQLPTGGAFNAVIVERAMDRTMVVAQQLKEVSDRTLKLPASEPVAVDLPVLASLKGKYLAWDGNGNPYGSAGTGADAGLRADLLASGGAALVSFTRSDTGAAARTLQAKLRDYLSARDFGVTGDGTTNDTAAMNNALAAAYLTNKKLYFPAGTYRYNEASAGAGYALLNRGVSVVGDGMFTTIFAPLSTMPNTADFMLVNPNAGADISGLELAHFFVSPKFDGTIRGRKGIYMLFNVVSNLSKLHVHNVCIRDCSDSALEVANNIATNTQGVPAFSCIENNLFYDGLKFVGIGDSNTIRNNFFNTPVGSGRVGIHLYHVDNASVVSSHTMIHGNAIVCSGGALFVDRGRNIKFFHNNVEQSHGPGSNQAVVDINGAGGVIPCVEIKGNHFGVFGTTTVQRVVRLNAVAVPEVEGNTILSGIVLPAAIVVHSPAQDAYVGRNAVDTSKFTVVVDDQGARTAGVQRTLTIGAAGVAAAAGYAAPAYFKDKEGTVSLKGAFSGAAVATNTTLGTLPAGYRPAGVERFVTNATVGGGPVSAAIEIDTAGAVKFITESGVAATFGTLSGIQFTTTPIVLSTT